MVLVRLFNSLIFTTFYKGVPLEFTQNQYFDHFFHHEIILAQTWHLDIRDLLEKLKGTPLEKQGVKKVYTFRPSRYFFVVNKK